MDALLRHLIVGSRWQATLQSISHKVIKEFHKRVLGWCFNASCLHVNVSFSGELQPDLPLKCLNVP